MKACLRQIWVFCASLGAAASYAQDAKLESEPNRNVFDPTTFIEYQEFKEAKEKERNHEKLRFEIVDRDGVSYVHLQSSAGTIQVPATQDLNREVLKDARCTTVKPISRETAVLTKMDYEISKRIKAYSGIILTAINEQCGKGEEQSVPYATGDLEVGAEVKEADHDQRTSIFSRQSLPKAIKGIYDPNIGIRKEY